ncbi:MAG: hypothetical protein ABIQ99_03885 [Thermoflexales bacterium]
MRALISHSDGLLISSPEYVHGVPGTLITLSTRW